MKDAKEIVATLVKKEVPQLVAEIKSLCEDRLDAKTADGNILGYVFTALEQKLAEKKK